MKSRCRNHILSVVTDNEARNKLCNVRNYNLLVCANVSEDRNK